MALDFAQLPAGRSLFAKLGPVNRRAGDAAGRSSAGGALVVAKLAQAMPQVRRSGGAPVAVEVVAAGGGAF